MAGKLKGTVRPGAGEGRAQGYPTANLKLAPEAARPVPGIYACWVVRGQARHPGALVVGVQAEGSGVPRVEVHLIGFSGDLYGEELMVEVLEKIREVEQFADEAALRQRIAQDIAAISALLGL